MQKGDSALFKQLAKHYAVHLKETELVWGEALANIGEIWFGIRIPKQGGNPLFDMMGSMLFGGSGAQKTGATPKTGTPRSGTPKPKVEAPKKADSSTPAAADTAPESTSPPAMDLD